MQPFLVYRYMPSNCSDTYYGKSHRHSFTRVVEVTGVSNLAGNQLKMWKILKIQKIYYSVIVPLISTTLVFCQLAPVTFGS